MVQPQDGLTWQNWLNLFSMVADITVYGVVIATGRQFDAKTQGDTYPSLIYPAGSTFVIWGPIYLLGTIFAIAQMLPSYRQNPLAQTVAPYFGALHFGQVVWYTVTALNLFKVATIVILSLLAAAAAALITADKAKPSTEAGEWWLLRSSLSLHTGWLTAASLVAINLSATSLQASPALLHTLATLSLFAVAAVATFFALLSAKPDAALALTVAWALVGIRQELQNPTALLNPNRPYFFAWPQVVIDGFSLLTVVLAALCSLLAIGALALRFYYVQPQPYLPLATK